LIRRRLFRCTPPAQHVGWRAAMRTRGGRGAWAPGKLAPQAHGVSRTSKPYLRFVWGIAGHGSVFNAQVAGAKREQGTRAGVSPRIDPRHRWLNQSTRSNSARNVLAPPEIVSRQTDSALQAKRHSTSTPTMTGHPTTCRYRAQISGTQPGATYPKWLSLCATPQAPVVIFRIAAHAAKAEHRATRSVEACQFPGG
jgi:hypothetical protein